MWNTTLKAPLFYAFLRLAFLTNNFQIGKMEKNSSLAMKYITCIELESYLHLSH